jgi:hypothetical protein
MPRNDPATDNVAMKKPKAIVYQLKRHDSEQLA